MTTAPDPYSTDAYVLLDADVLRDMADALDGRWSPAVEPDPLRAERLLAAGRLRLYAERDRSGWYLVTYRQAREAALTRGDADWSVGFIPVIDDLADAPAPEEVAALVRLYGDDEIRTEAATALAQAVLFEPIQVLITVEPRDFRHSRDDDLPERLEIMTVAEAVERLELAPGELPPHGPPEGSALADIEPWWVA